MQLPARLANLAAHQSGLLTAQQCRDAGITPDAIRAAVRSGRWEGRHRGVYQTRPGRNDWLSEATAGLLACGEPAALGYASAARLIGLNRGRFRFDRSGHPEPVHICIPETRRVAAVPGVQLHRVTAYDQRLQWDVWPTRTSNSDTVLDMAGISTLEGAVGWVAQAVRLELTTTELLLECLDRRGRHRHAADLRELLDDSGIESAAELRFARDVAKAHGLPEGRRQAPDARRGLRVVDVQYDEYRLRVEIDGREGHEGWWARRRDATKDIEAAADGWISIRPGWVDVRVHPCDLGLSLARILGRQGWTGRPHGCRRQGCAVRAALTS